MAAPARTRLSLYQTGWLGLFPTGDGYMPLFTLREAGDTNRYGNELRYVSEQACLLPFPRPGATPDASTLYATVIARLLDWVDPHLYEVE